MLFLGKVTGDKLTTFQTVDNVDAAAGVAVFRVQIVLYDLAEDVSSDEVVVLHRLHRRGNSLSITVDQRSIHI
jgi:hypothetical protein